MGKSSTGDRGHLTAGASKVYRPLEDLRFRSWLSITPVANLQLDRSILKTGELEIAGITFMDLERLRHVARRRWGEAGASLRSSFERMFLQPYRKVGSARPPVEVVAIRRADCRGAELEEGYLDSVRDSLAILSSSLWVYRRRDPLSAFGPLENAARGQRIWFFQDTQSPAQTSFGAMAWTKGLMPLQIDGFWVAAEKTHHFVRSLEGFVTDSAAITPAWQRAVRRALRLFGEGYLQHDAQQAMLANMIALDLLLFENGERQKRQAQLLSASLDWARLYTPPGARWADKEALERLLDIRNHLVHEGYSDDITAHDLLLSDDVVGNLLLLIVRNRSKLNSKDELRTYAERELARRTLQIVTQRRFARRNPPVAHQWRRDQREKLIEQLAGLSGTG